MTTPPGMPHTRPMTRILATLALLASVLLAAPAHADSTTPTLEYPLSRVGDTVDVEVMVQAPTKAWGIRRAAKFYDAQVDGLTIHTRGTCAARPQAVCVRVIVDDYSPEEMLALDPSGSYWHGLTALGATERTIYLNLAGSVPNARWMDLRTARHELGHALGLAHHDGTEGVMVTEPKGGGEISLWPSTAELDALRAWYAVPRA